MNKETHKQLSLCLDLIANNGFNDPLGHAVQRFMPFIRLKYLIDMEAMVTPTLFGGRSIINIKEDKPWRLMVTCPLCLSHALFKFKTEADRNKQNHCMLHCNDPKCKGFQRTVKIVQVGK